MNGFVFYEGPSLLDDAPIVGIVTGIQHDSANSKTGPMCQAWILRADMDPSSAIKSGHDASICGNCQHRSAEGNIGRSCYVIWWLGPMSVYKAYKAKKYLPLQKLPISAETWMEGHHVRLGAYGDPAAIPYKAWLPIVSGSSGAIGYTQQWRTCDPMFSRIIMASVQSEAEKQAAHALGWRTFRTRPFNAAVLDDEVICPASHEAGQSATCRECQLCQGTTKQAKSVAIMVHGQRAHWFAPAAS